MARYPFSPSRAASIASLGAGRLSGRLGRTGPPGRGQDEAPDRASRPGGKLAEGTVLLAVTETKARVFKALFISVRVLLYAGLPAIVFM